MKITHAVTDDGSAYCWGRNSKGQLGDGTDTYHDEPNEVSLPTGRTVTSLATGKHHTCGIMDDDSTYCWGENNYGQLEMELLQIVGRQHKSLVLEAD